MVTKVLSWNKRQLQITKTRQKSKTPHGSERVHLKKNMPEEDLSTLGRVSAVKAQLLKISTQDISHTPFPTLFRLQSSCYLERTVSMEGSSAQKALQSLCCRAFYSLMSSGTEAELEKLLDKRYSPVTFWKDFLDWTTDPDHYIGGLSQRRKTVFKPTQSPYQVVHGASPFLVHHTRTKHRGLSQGRTLSP